MISAFVEPSSLVALLASGRAPEIAQHHALILTVLPAGMRRAAHLARHPDFDEQLQVLERRGHLITTTTRGDVSTTLLLARYLDTATSALAAAAMNVNAPVVFLSDDARTLRTVQRERPDLPLSTALTLLRTWYDHASNDSAALLARVGQWFTPTRTHPEAHWWQAELSGEEQFAKVPRHD